MTKRIMSLSQKKKRKREVRGALLAIHCRSTRAILTEMEEHTVTDAIALFPKET